MRRKIYPILFCFMCAGIQLSAQCPQLFDFFGTPSNAPEWYHCNGTDYTLNIQSPNNIGNWTIDWGDGSPIESGTDLIPPASISHNYAAAVDVYTVTFTATDVPCTITGTLTMEEATSASIQIPVGGLTQACAPQDMEFINSSTNVSENTVFVWDFGDGSPPLTFDHTNWLQTITHTYQENTVDCETVVTLTAENQCNIIQGGNSTATFDPIRIWDYDDAAITPSDFVLCWPDNTVDYLNTTERNCLFQGNIYQRYEYWNFGDYWGLGYDSIVDWTPWPPTFPQTISYPAIGDYTVMMLDSNFCGIDTAFVTISIVPPPTAGITSSMDTICEGEAVTFFNNSSAESNAWWINFDDGAGWENMGAISASHVYNTPGDYNIGLVAYVAGAGAACTDTAWVPLHVRPGPLADFTMPDDEACDSLTVSFVNNSVDALTYNWNFGNGNTSALENPPDEFYNTVGTNFVTLSVIGTNGCSDTQTQTVTIHQSPFAQFSTLDVCLGDTATFLDGSIALPTEPILTWDWDFGNGDSSTDTIPRYAFTTGGLYNVTLTVNTAFCVDDTTIVLNVDTPPTVDFTHNPTVGCSPLEVDFTNNSIGASTYLWSFGDGAISTDTNAVHTYNNPLIMDSIFEVVLRGFNPFGCSASDTSYVTVYGHTIAAFTSDASPICAPAPVQFTNSSVGATGFEWNFGDGSPLSTDVDPNHLFENNTGFIQYYDVQLVAFNVNGCHDTTFQTVTSYPEPDFNFDISGSSGCSPVAITFPSVTGAVTYDWDFGDGQIGTGPSPFHVYQNLSDTVQDLTVRLIAANAFGCVDTAFSTISIYPLPTADFDLDPVRACSPVQVTVTDQSTLADEIIWRWGTGDTLVDNGATQTYDYVNNGSLPVSYTITQQVTTVHGCTATLNNAVTIDPLVTAGFTHPTEGCAPFTVPFMDTSTGATNYLWEFGDGQTSITQEPVHLYQNVGTTTQSFDIRLIVANDYGCQDTAYSSVDVFPAPLAQFSMTPMQGCSPLNVLFENQSIIPAQSEWIFTPGDTLLDNSASLEETFVNNTTGLQTFPVELIVTSAEGCVDQVVQNVNVYPEVEASFLSDTAGCAPLEITFINTSDQAVMYEWNFGDGLVSIEESPVHTYLNTTTDAVTREALLIARNNFGCADTATVEIDVYPTPIAQFDAVPSAGCSPLEVNLLNTSFLAHEVLWTYGDGQFSDTTAAGHIHTYVNGGNTPLTFTTTLDITTEYGCTDQTQRDIDVFPEVHAHFENIDEGCSPLTVDFDNNTTGATSYLWNFGNGFSDFNAEPEHVYLNNSLQDTAFVVELIATSVYGCTDTHQDTIEVFHLPQPAFALSAIEGCSPLDVELFDNSLGADTYLWEYGDGQTSDTIAATHWHTFQSTSTQPQVFDIVLNTWTDHGCFAQTQQSLNVFPDVIADFDAVDALCSGSDITFFNTSTGAMSYQWTYSTGEGSVITDPTTSFENFSGQDNTFYVTLTATSQYGCVDDHTDSVLVYTAPVADISIDSTSLCHPLFVVFENNTLYADSYAWDYGDGTTSNEDATFHDKVFTNTTTNLIDYEIVMTATTIEGCTDTAMTAVQVIPPLSAEFEPVENGCHPLEVAFVNESENALGYEWIFGDDEGSEEFEPVHTYFNYGITDEEFLITLVTHSYFGCTDTAQQVLTVFPTPDAEFDVDPTLQVFPESTVNIFDNSVSGSATYTWTLGDGTTSNDPTLMSHTYATWGSYVITLTIDNGHCMDVMQQDVEIQAPPPVADFAGEGEGCAPLTIQFQNFSQYGTDYLWNFGDGGVSANAEPLYTYYIPGTYTVSLLVTGPGGAEIAVRDTVVKVRPNANAYFTANPDVVATGDPVFFYNLSNQADDFFWDFGDGVTTTERDPIHIYQDIGSYPVTLIADNEYNCPDTFRLEDAVLVDAGGYIRFPNAFTPDEGASDGGSYDPNRLDNNVFFPVFGGVEEFQMQIYNRWGELLFETNDVNIGWDGRYRGRLAQQGVYVWRAEVTFTDGKQVVRAGDVTLLR